MPPLTDLEIERLASDIQKTLLATRFACSSLMRITGGSTSYTFRGLLQMPLAVFDRKPTTTVIVKKATDHAAINTDFALDSSRSRHGSGLTYFPTYEDEMLRALQYSKLNVKADPIPVTVPKIIYYDPRARVQVIEDLQPAVDLASILTGKAKVNVQEYATVGIDIGNWLRRFHIWTQGPTQTGLRRTIALNTSSQDLKWRTTYDTIVETVKAFPAISQENMGILQAVRARALNEHEQHAQLSSDDSLFGKDCGLVHADFWTGNVLFTTSPSPQLYIIDWEFAQLGHRAMDLGQMIGDLLEKGYMFSSVNVHCKTLLDDIVKGYGGISDEMQWRVVIHAGVHMVNWCARHPGADLVGKVEVLTLRAVEMIVRAWKHDREWFEEDVLGCLFARSTR